MRAKLRPKSSGFEGFEWVIFFIPIAGWILPDQILLRVLNFLELLSLPLPNTHAIGGYEQMYERTWDKPFPIRTHFLLVAIGYFLILWSVLLVVRFLSACFLKFRSPPIETIKPAGLWLMFAIGFCITIMGFLFVPGSSVGRGNASITFWGSEFLYCLCAWMLAAALSGLEQVATRKIDDRKKVRRSE